MIAYKIIAADGRGYIGITTQSLEKRLKQHGRRFGLYVAEVLFHALSHDDLLAAERELIKQHRTRHPDGHNKNAGGQGQYKRVWGEETKKKIAASLRGRPRDPVDVERTAATHRGRKRSAETRARMREARARYVISPETRAKISATLRGRPTPPEVIAKRKATRSARRNRP